MTIGRTDRDRDQLHHGVGKLEAAVQHDARERGEVARLVGHQHGQQHLGAVGGHHNDGPLREPRQDVAHRHGGHHDSERLAGEEALVAHQEGPPDRLDDRAHARCHQHAILRQRPDRDAARLHGNGRSGGACAVRSGRRGGRGLRRHPARRARSRRGSSRGDRDPSGSTRCRSRWRARYAAPRGRISVICRISSAVRGSELPSSSSEPWPRRPPSTSSTGAPRFAAMRALKLSSVGLPTSV